MGFRRSDLQEAFFVPGTYPFRVWGYGTTDPLGEVLSPEYFRAAGGLMHPGDLIYVSTRPRRARGDAPEMGETRMALVMVRGGERGAPSVRLVQDYGCPDDPDAGSVTPPAAASAVALAPKAQSRRGRGRPPGSRSKRFAGTAAVDVSASASETSRSPHAGIPGDS